MISQYSLMEHVDSRFSGRYHWLGLRPGKGKEMQSVKPEGCDAAKDMAGERRKAKEAEAKIRQQEAEDERAAPVLMQGDNIPTGGTVPLAHFAAPGHFQYDPTVPPGNAAALK